MKAMKHFYILMLKTLLNFIILSSLSALSYGDIRCHCNQPQCVRTGYMCKSTGALAACFAEHSGYANGLGISDISRHGCIELLPQQMRDMCVKNLQQRLPPLRTHHSHSHRSHSHRHHTTNESVICCSEDMCNYVKNVDIINSHTKANESQSVGSMPASQASTLPNSVWFQVTVITVPIAGSIVLVILIFMATKVLRQDTKRQRHMNEIRKQRQFKTHLLLNSGNSALVDAKQNIQTHNHDKSRDTSASAGSNTKADKNEMNAKINDLEKGCDMSGTTRQTHSNGSHLYNIINMSYKDSNNTSADQQSARDKDSLFGKPNNCSLYSSLLPVNEK